MVENKEQQISPSLFVIVGILIALGSIFVNVVFMKAVYIKVNGTELDVPVESKTYTHSSGRSGKGDVKWPVVLVTMPGDRIGRGPRSVEIDVEQRTWDSIQPGQRVRIIKHPDRDEAILRDEPLPGSQRLIWTFSILISMTVAMLIAIKKSSPSSNSTPQ